MLHYRSLWVHRISFTLLASVLAFLSGQRDGGASEVVYDNTQKDYLNFYYATALEFGDEIILGGTSREIMEFQLEYLGDFAIEQEPTAVVRFYANDVPLAASQGQFYLPGTQLYESPPQRIFPGYNILALRNLSVTASNSFTWTIQFAGLSGGYSNQAGLVFYDPPAVGRTYDDFWQKSLDGWNPMRYENGDPPGNFAARLFARSATPAEVLSVTPLAGGRHLVQVRGAAYDSAVLEVSTSQSDWETVTSVVCNGSKVDILDWRARTEPVEYRLRLLDVPLLMLSAGKQTPDRNQPLRITGLPSKGYQVEAAWDLASWLPIWTNDFRGVHDEFVDKLAPNFGQRFYRANWIRDLPAYLASVGYLTNGQTMLNFNGPPGRDCVIEASRDFMTWTPLSTNTFSFTSRTVVWVDPGTTNQTQRFYRIKVMP